MKFICIVCQIAVFIKLDSYLPYEIHFALDKISRNLLSARKTNYSLGLFTLKQNSRFLKLDLFCANHTLSYLLYLIIF